MSTIEVVNKNGKFGVYVQDPSAKKGTPAEKGVEIPCKSEAEATQLAQELKKAEAEFKASQVDTAKVKEATLPPEQGKVMDKAA